MQQEPINIARRIFICALVFPFSVFIGISCNKKVPKEIPEKIKGIKTISRKHLPDELEECSGVELGKDNLLWMLNDSYNTNELFSVDPAGRIISTIRLKGVDNNDWEDLAKDDKGNIYIGDFGNNDNDRRDLAILVIPLADHLSNDSCKAEMILFSLEDQKEFPPKEDELHFDIEAFFVWDESIYLFTKDRTEPFVGLTKMYQLPSKPGRYKAKYINSFYTKPDFYQGAITSADISPDGTIVALLSNENIWLFTDFNDFDFLSGKSTCIALQEEHQYEGLVFKDNNSLYITNELDDDGETQLEEILIQKQ
ncbi:hypothetical protein EMN47_11060 [Prolixibacteraceae bacterium JC049]|nr:hypothetical protein [Prolixibacteraceae bacterium JC049]